MTDWTKETKVQAPHWKSEDITTRGVSRGMYGDLSRGERAAAIHNDISADVMRIDRENAYGSKTTVDHTEETKSTVDWSEESK